MARSAIAAPYPLTREWAFGDGSGAGVRVCILDSGVDATHPDVGGPLAAYQVAEADGSGGYTVVPDADGDVAGHGTACASIVRALAPACEMTSVRVLGGALRGRGDALIAALEWALDEGFDIVNMSLSTRHPDFRDAIRDLSDRAYFGGTTIVAAANNRPVASYPWRFPAVISVGSHATQDGEHIEVNPAPPVEFFALGINVLAAQPGNRRVRLSGNSFAAPHVTGMCARILNRHPGFGAPQLKAVLAGIANNLT
ncbi:S8 family serine peptidase [Phytohabitans flavus]|uniref:S8 family serine peptidase n=1 Tax=Phytohabitans flavus TaxID=1076124 RepID=UPI00156418C8|nr:S8 family serine peptidase [Phytohabitans flavus]